MAYELFIANRYLKSKRKTGFISLSTYISTFGVMFGVAALIVVLSIMNGFEDEIRSRIIGFGAHIELKNEQNDGIEDYGAVQKEISQNQHIVGVSPFVNEKALILSQSRKHGISIKGVDDSTLDRVSNIRQKINYGVFGIGEVETDENQNYPGIVVGTYLADKLGLDLGDKVQVLSPSGISPLMSSIPHLKTFKVTGFFETGIFEYDDVYAYVSLREAQSLFEMKDKVSGLEIKLDDLNHAELVATQLQQTLGPGFTAMTWFEMNKNLFAWMQIEKWGMFVALSLIVMVAAFNIISTLIMIVLEKTKEIGILKSMGASSKSIMRIFVYEGLIGGLIGTALGCIIGFCLCWLQLKFELISLPPDVYIISAMPVSMNAWDFFFIATVSILLCYLATVYPARKAAILEPVEAMRYK